MSANVKDKYTALMWINGEKDTSYAMGGRCRCMDRVPMPAYKMHREVDGGSHWANKRQDEKHEAV
jgi:hypothetical protein